MKKQYSFRDHHLLALLQVYDEKKLPLDLTISQYFKDHKALGSKDRALIAETLYTLLRWKGLIDFFIEDPNWEKRLYTLKNLDIKKESQNPLIPKHIAISFPEFLYRLISKSYPEPKATELCLISNYPAPTTIRVNTLKISREELLKKWEHQFDISPTLYSKDGIVFHKKIAFFTLPEFKEGLFEVQDEASQLLSQLIQVKKGEKVLDYCAGSGGKTLAFAPKMEMSGQIYLHDIRKHILLEAKKRLKRAGIQNAQVIQSDSPYLSKLKKQMDWVLVDAPCSGTGTMRRNPDMKWQFNEEAFQRLLGQQRSIFEKALSFLKPNGKIVYATCSILNEENENQVDHFLKTYNLKLHEPLFKTLPSEGGMDGFFGAVFTR
jgi:16S rRNA (cytosine967-C5)-methyltransferase